LRIRMVRGAHLHSFDMLAELQWYREGEGKPMAHSVI
jgi:hypothetical protein